MIREVTMAVALGVAAGPALGQILNEIRVDQPSTDNDEYVEIMGVPATSLDDLSIVVIGDGGGGSGTIEEAIDLSGNLIPADGHFLVAEDGDTLGETTDLIVPLNLENSDNVTYLLVEEFSGMVGDDLDTDNDGILDAMPWADIVDCVALIETPGSGEEVYCDTQVGPDGPYMPGHVFRCVPDGDWTIGIFDPLDGVDTPGLENADCGVIPGVNLSVLKTGTLVAVSGADAVYEITVRNFGLDPALNVTITDTLPAGVTFVAESSPVDVVFAGTMGQDVDWTIASLEPIGVRVITIQVTIGAQVTGDIVNSVEVTTTSDDNPDDNVADYTTTVSAPIANIPDVLINEIRSDQDGSDPDEYLELRGTAFQDMTGLTYIVLGDGAPEDGSGVIESITPLSGQFIPVDGHWIAAEDTFTLLPTPSIDLILPAGALNYENADTTTHLLVANFTGALGIDLDVGDDGIIDSPLPWTDVVDAVGVLDEAPPPTSSEISYAGPLGFDNVGPTDNLNAPGHVYRCQPSGTWAIGPFDIDSDDDGTPDGEDTPGALNLDCTISIAVEKDGPVAATPGATMVYTLTVYNLGREVVDNVSIVDALPAGVTFIGEVSSLDVMFVDMTPPDLEWMIASLGAGVVEVIEVTVTVDAQTSGDIVNSVTVSTTTGGDDPVDNADTATTTVSGVADPPEDVFINEIRTSQPGDDNDEYFELIGDVGTSLDGMTYLVIGDGSAAAGSGVIERVVPLHGYSIQADGLLLAAEDTFTLPGTPDLTLIGAELFEGSDNVTHVLAANFNGSPGIDVDTNDDGVIDVTPWSVVTDAIGLVEETDVPPTNTEYAYGADLGFEDIGPEVTKTGTFVPGHAYRCTSAMTWTIGVFPVDASSNDTPDADNDACVAGPCQGDTNADGDVDVNDLNNVILDWGMDGSVNGGDITGPVPGSPPDGIVNVNDLNAVIVNWGLCP